MGNIVYDKANTKQVKFKFNLKTDADILEHLKNQTNIQGYIKQLIRADIAARAGGEGIGTTPATGDAGGPF